MGELKPDPCPFCGSDAVVVNDGQASFMVGCTSPACGICNAARDFTSEADAITAWNTRPRTEGRGEGEKLFPLLASSWFYGGWRAETHNERQMQAVMERAGWWPITSEAELLEKLDASPIREPEISRTKRDEIEKLLRENLPATCGLHCQREQTQAEEDAAYRYTADAILNLAPVGGRGEEGSSQSQPGVSAVQQPASPSAQHSDGRSATDYAIEHGGYLAEAVSAFLGLTSREIVFDPDAEEALRDEIGDHLQAMRSGVYEFEKRVTRAKALSGAQRSELSTQLRDQPSSSNTNEESQTNGS